MNQIKFINKWYPNW